MEDKIANLDSSLLIKETTIALIKSGNWVQDRIADILKEHGLSVQQFNVLRILRGRSGQPANLNMIQERMITRMSNTTRLVDKLLLKKLVARNICKENRRKVEIFITKEGLKLLIILDPIIKNTEKNILKMYSQDELKVLNELLYKLKKIEA